MIRGHMNEFHWLTTVMSTSVEMIGFDTGTTMEKRMRICPAPSMVAASMISWGI